MQSQTMPPQAVLQQLIGGQTVTNLIYVVAELGIADLLIDGPRTSEELASTTGANHDALRRVLRGLTVVGVLVPAGGDRFALTPVGACLATDAPGSLRPLARLCGHPTIQATWAELLHTVRTGEPALDHAVGEDGFAYMAQNPELAALFNEMMAGVTAGVAPSVVEAYDFSGVRSIVDVGGGDGTLVRSILRAYPDARGIIYDLAYVRERAEQAIAADGLADCCRFETGDFFREVPADADVYLLKSVIHDWDDERSVAILAACRRAMPADGKVLLVEGLLTEDAISPDVVMGDLIMLAMGSGRERTEAEHRSLLNRAGLRLTNVVPTRSSSSILEAVAMAAEPALGRSA